LTSSSTVRSSSGVSPWPWLKSKRSLSGRTAGAALADVLAERAPERPMQEVGARVVRHGRPPVLDGDARPDGLPAGQRAALGRDEERLVRVEPEHVVHRCPPAVPLERPRVGHLAAALGVERRGAELDQQPAVADGLHRVGGRRHVEPVVADERGGERRLAGERRRPLAHAAAPAAGGGPGAGALLVHQVGEAHLVEGQIVLGGDLGRHLDREAVRVVQAEGVLGGDHGGTPSRRTRAMTSSSSASPVSSVRAKRSSSAVSRAATSSRRAASSG
jgi:hypothetical protein